VTPKPKVTPKVNVIPTPTAKSNVNNKPSIASTTDSSKIKISNLKPGQKIKVTVKVKEK
jgi:hypothetical protein